MLTNLIDKDKLPQIFGICESRGKFIVKCTSKTVLYTTDSLIPDFLTNRCGFGISEIFSKVLERKQLSCKWFCLEVKLQMHGYTVENVISMQAVILKMAFMAINPPTPD